MSYYSEVYVNRVTKGIQDPDRYKIALAQKEHQFALQILNSQCRCRLNDSSDGILKENLYNLAKDTAILLVENSSTLGIGNAVKIYPYSNPDFIEYWLLYYQDKDIALGYKRFYAVRLNNIINDTKCHYATAADINDIFNRTLISPLATIFESDVRMGLITNTALFDYGDTFSTGANSWRVDNINSYSINGIYFYSLTEYYNNEQAGNETLVAAGTTVIHLGDTLSRTGYTGIATNGDAISISGSTLTGAKIGEVTITYYLNGAVDHTEVIKVNSPWINND